MRMKIVVRGVLFAILSSSNVKTLPAVDFTFDSASPDVQEYVIDSITNCVSTASIALMHERTDEALREEDGLMPWPVSWELGLQERRCVEMLKGDASSAGYKVCYLYRSPQDAGERAVFVGDVVSDGRTSGFRYYKGGKYYHGRGKDIWKLFPPYDPFSSHGDEFVQLMLLTPERNLDVRCLRPGKSPCETNAIARLLGRDPRGMTSQELMQALHVERAFSNRVLRVNDGCAFQVDYPVPDLDWRRKHLSQKEHLERLKNIQLRNSVLMHLSHREVSEITLLAFAAAGKTEGYAAARERCQKILKPVERLQTTIGILLYQAMSEGHGDLVWR